MLSLPCLRVTLFISKFNWFTAFTSHFIRPMSICSYAVISEWQVYLIYTVIRLKQRLLIGVSVLM